MVGPQGVGRLERLRPVSVAAGGEAVARDQAGRVVLVAGALPGETVDAEVTQMRTDYARAQLRAVVEASPDRVPPPCPHVARGCGGCGWQHISIAAQRRLKASVVVEALRRGGRLNEPVVSLGQELPAFGYRTILRLAVAGRPSFRRYRANDLVEVDSCLVAHPLLAPLLTAGSFGAATEAVLRCGARTGELLAVLSPSAAGADLGPSVRLVGQDELAAGRRAWIFEEIAGRGYGCRPARSSKRTRTVRRCWWHWWPKPWQTLPTGPWWMPTGAWACLPLPPAGNGEPRYWKARPPPRPTPG